MASLKEVRIRIASVNSTKQITSAMKMVSASKLRRAQERILGLRPYFKEMKILFEQIVSDKPFEVDSPFFHKREGGRVLCVVMSSNRGLCGTFNANVNKYIESFLETEHMISYSQNNAVDFIVFGKRVGEYLTKKNYNILEQHLAEMEKPVAAEIFNITGDMLDKYLAGKWDAVYLIYNQFRNPAMQEVGHEQLLPIPKTEVPEEFFYPEIEFIVQPDIDAIVSTLLPDYLKSSVYKAVLETSAGEHGARMTAMHKATDNATELIKELKLSYNKARQAAITKEIIEIVSGANALQ